MRNTTPLAVDTFLPGMRDMVRCEQSLHADIRNPKGELIVGGFGIMFDAEPEFAAMLRGALDDKENVSALVIDRSGRIVFGADTSRQTVLNITEVQRLTAYRDAAELMGEAA